MTGITISGLPPVSKNFSYSNGNKLLRINYVDISFLLYPIKSRSIS